MDFQDFAVLWQEIGLLAVFLSLIVFDIFAPERAMRWLRPTACILMALHTAAGFVCGISGSAFGGMYYTDGMTILMKNIMNLGALVVLLQSGRWLRSDFIKIREGEFYIITLATLLGMYFMVSAGNFMMLYLGIETSSLPMACLAAYNKYREESAEAGAKYILMSALSSGITMFGISYLYGATGTLYYADVAAAINVDPLTVVGFVFFLSGIAFKISIVPFHLWTADVYEGAPTGVTAYLSVVSKASACFVLVFTLYRVFGPLEAIWHDIMWWLALATIVVGNLFAIRQRNLKRLLAYSSISQAGYILLGIMGGSAQGMTATVYFILVYLFSNLAAFGVVASVENSSGRTDMAGIRGLYKTNPRLAFVMMLAVFSLAGIPPLSGFFSKFFIFAAAAAKGEYLLVFIALLNTVISLYYYLLIVKAMFIDRPAESPLPRIATDPYNRISLVLCTAGILAAGILSGIYEYIGSVSWGM